MCPGLCSNIPDQGRGPSAGPRKMPPYSALLEDVCLLKKGTKCPEAQQVGNGNADRGNGLPGRTSTGRYVFKGCRAASWDVPILDFSPYLLALSQ